MIDIYAQLFSLKLDFYDRGRVASWVRCHPSLILWVRDKMGKKLQAWQPYGNWSQTPGGNEAEYLIDEKVRLYNEADPRYDGKSAIDGMNALRSVLHQPATSVRLIGLSGVGKTRLLQALFDHRVGEKPLITSHVFYADMGESPVPEPRAFAEQLIALQRRALLIIDNCPPDLHRRLSSVCTGSGSLVSLITVEYDVREDQPEETNVFHLEPASGEVIEKVITIRFKHISGVDARTIAEFSGGNFKIAIALAKTIERGETIADLRDAELFERLFSQRNVSNHTLLKSAEVCSLVYSFDYQTEQGMDQELRVLSALADSSVQQIYADVAELQRRQLVQQRNIWRAVLPHAIANRLAKRALENIPLTTILNAFESSTERLLKSFSRRLSYLHDSEKAREVATRWLSEDGLLQDIRKLNPLGIDLLRHIAPIVPQEVLAAVERVTRGEEGQEFISSPEMGDFTDILRSLAYDNNLFDRCVALLCQRVLLKPGTNNQDQDTERLKSLFYLYLSGTHATLEQRKAVISRLLHSDNEHEQSLGMTLLTCALEATHFSSHYSFDFGARPRDYGYTPSITEDVRNWFRAFAQLACTITVSDSKIAPRAKDLLAEKFRGLWMHGAMFDELEQIASVLYSNGAWNQGWVAVRSTIRFDAKRMQDDILQRIRKLEEMLRPDKLIEQARTYAFSSGRGWLDLADTEDDDGDDAVHASARVEEKTQEIGKEVAQNREVFLEILPELFNNVGSRHFSFGKGLAEGCADSIAMWEELCHQLSQRGHENADYAVLCGFLNQLSHLDSTLPESILNTAITDPTLGYIFPYLQTSVDIGNQGAERLMQALQHEVAPIQWYKHLAYGMVHQTIDDENLSVLLRSIASKENGLPVALDILGMRLHKNSGESTEVSEVLMDVGQELVVQFPIDHEQHDSGHLDYELGTIIKKCFRKDDSAAYAETLSKNLASAMASYKIYIMEFEHVLEALANTQPLAFLNGFLTGIAEHERRTVYFFDHYREDRINPLSCIDDDLIIDWCEDDPTVRYPLISACIPVFGKSGQNGRLGWSSLALTIIANAPDPIEVLNNFKQSFRPMSCSGSRANIMERGLTCISALKEHEHGSVAEWARNTEIQFKEEIASERELEASRDMRRNESFE